MAKLQAKLDSLDDLDESLHGLYVERNGAFYLDVDGVEFEDNVSGMKKALDRQKREIKELKEAIQQYDGIDPEKAREAQARLNEIEDKQLLDEGKLDELVEKRVSIMRQDFEGKTKALQKSLEAAQGDNQVLTGRLSEVLIDSAITNAATKAGVRPEAVDDVLNRGRRVYTLVDGVPIPKDGDTVIYGKDGSEPLPIEDWVSTLQRSAPHLFGETSGGGATNQSRGGVSLNGKVSSSDANAIAANLEAIANGEIELTD